MTANGQTVPLTATPVTGTQTLITAAALGSTWCTPGGSTLGVAPAGGGVGTTLPPPDFCIDPITGIVYTYTFAAYATDHLGTVRAILTTNPDGTTGLQTFDYEPFGVEITSPNDIACGNTHRFTGQERDTETGNDYFHFRMLASSMGRFMKPDDNFDGAVGNPQGFNLYSYVRGNPVNFRDPTGHARQDGGFATRNSFDSGILWNTDLSVYLWGGGGGAVVRTATYMQTSGTSSSSSMTASQFTLGPQEDAIATLPYPTPTTPDVHEDENHNIVDAEGNILNAPTIVRPPAGYVRPPDPGIQNMREWGQTQGEVMYAAAPRQESMSAVMPPRFHFSRFLYLNSQHLMTPSGPIPLAAAGAVIGAIVTIESGPGAVAGAGYGALIGFLVGELLFIGESYYSDTLQPPGDPEKSIPGLGKFTMQPTQSPIPPNTPRH